MTQPITLSQALAAARETKALEIGQGILGKTPEVFREQFGSQEAVIVADPNTFAAAGRAVQDAFRAAGLALREPYIFQDPALYGETRFVEELEAALGKHQAIAVAVGSGTVNDLAKLASHRVGRSYMCVGTAASMDGYTAFGASITHQGLKQTFFCPAPAAVVADLDVICAAPDKMNAWGYTDLVAKVPAGADWILADLVGTEPIHEQAWSIVQGRLREAISDAKGVRERNPAAVGQLVEGLMLGGFAMQAARSSRPASGAEHQFSHLWDMQHHTHNGKPPSHGFKVGIGTLAVTALYEHLLEQPLDELDVDACCADWPTAAEFEKRARDLLKGGELLDGALKELEAKYIPPENLREELKMLRTAWPALRNKLREQLLPLDTLKGMLRDVGAPTEPEEIGITRERLRGSYWQAFCIRRRFTVLDLAVRTGNLNGALESIFGPGGLWPIKQLEKAV
jgi:glycerol-1-phosphate dehydrogenase [NAD(P)+]